MGKRTVEPVRYADPIETEVWEPNPEKPGYVRRVRGRPVKEVAGELEAKLDNCGLGGVEYVSTASAGSHDWPRGETFVALEVGGNEGYSLSVYCKLLDENGRSLTGGVDRLIRVKVLATRDDALALHAVVFHLLGS